MDEYKAQQKAARGDRAKRILQDEVFVSAVSEVRDAIHKKWSQTATEDTAGRETLFLMQRLLGEVVSQLGGAMREGQIALYNINSVTKKPHGRRE